jgi:SPP1 gp7 family putative phage head morphogenesis protein
MDGWSKVIDKIARDLYDGKIKPTDLNKDYILKTGNKLSEAIDEGYTRIDYTPEDISMKMRMKQNAFIFSSAKNIVFQHKLADQITDESGILRSWNDFKNSALEIDEEYNVNHLQSEWQTAKASANSSRKWQDIQRRADRYPYLEYKTVGDDKVRDEHAALDGIIRPINHPFWDTYFAPNGWRCRCYVRQTDKKPNGTNVPTPDDKTVPKYFRYNPGKTATALPDKHPYYSMLSELGIKRNVPDNVREFAKLEKVKSYKNGSEIYVSPFHDIGEFDKLTQNLSAARVIAHKYPKSKIELLPTYGERKSPEYIINGVIGDRYESKGAQSIAHAFKHKYKKTGQLRDYDESFLVFDFLDNNLNREDIEAVGNKLNGEFKSSTAGRKKNDHTYFLYKDRSAKISRGMNLESEIIPLLIKLWRD